MFSGSFSEMTNKSAWVTWETQRRSFELAKAIGCDFYLFEHNGFLRYPRCLLDTMKVFMKKDYSIVFRAKPIYDFGSICVSL